jgi:hypothetical protein
VIEGVYFIRAGYTPSSGKYLDVEAAAMTDLGGRTHVASRHVIDLALGILMGLRGCSEQEAFDDLVDAVHDIGADPDVLAHALVAVAAGAGAPLQYQRQVRQRWGHLLTSTMPSVRPPAE